MFTCKARAEGYLCFLRFIKSPGEKRCKPFLFHQQAYSKRETFAMKERIEKLPHKAINQKAWDDCISTGTPFLPDAFSWLLNELSPGWEGIVLYGEGGSYRAVLAVPLVSRFGFSFVRQSPFSFLLGVVAEKEVSDAERNKLLHCLLTSYRFISEYKLCTGFTPAASSVLSVQKESNFVLDLGKSAAEIREQYTKNRKRDLKKGRRQQLRLEETHSPAQFYALFGKYTQKKVYNFTDEMLEQSRTVFQLYQQHHMLKIFNVYAESECVGAAIFLVHQRGIYYLMASYSDAAHALGASTFLLDSSISAFAGTAPFLSFNGSREAGLARFYSSFGAEAFSFSILRQLRLPYAIRKLLAWRSKLLKAPS